MSSEIVLSVVGTSCIGLSLSSFGVATFEGGGGGYLRGVATWGFYWGPQKIDVNFGGSLLSLLTYYSVTN